MEQKTVNVAERISDMMLVPALLSGHHITVECNRESCKVGLYVEHEEYFSIYVFKDKYIFLGISERVWNRMYSKGYNNILLTFLTEEELYKAIEGAMT